MACVTRAASKSLSALPGEVFLLFPEHLFMLIPRGPNACSLLSASVQGPAGARPRYPGTLPFPFLLTVTWGQEAAAALAPTCLATSNVLSLQLSFPIICAFHDAYVKGLRVLHTTAALCSPGQTFTSLRVLQRNRASGTSPSVSIHG